MPQRQPTAVTLISDSTGELGEHVLHSVFTQFPASTFNLTCINFVNSEDKLEQCLKALRQASGMVVHTTIYESFKQRIEEVCRMRHLPVYDLTGPIMAFLTSSSGRKPEHGYSKIHELTPDYFNRLAAIGFAIEHDDGRGLRTINEADIVLTGVSRVTKTPTSMVLAMRGYRIANVPLVAGVNPPTELTLIDPRRVICLILSAPTLASIRATRAKEQLGIEGDYTDKRAIQRELIRTRQLSEQYGWRMLDVTGRSIEETAARVVAMVRPQSTIAPQPPARRVAPGR